MAEKVGLWTPSREDRRDDDSSDVVSAAADGISVDWKPDDLAERVASTVGEPRPVTVDRPGDMNVPARYRRIAILLGWSDGICVVAALLLSYTIRFGFRQMPPDYALVIAAAPALWLIVFHGYGLYSPWRVSALEEFRRIISATSVAMVVVVMLSFWSKSSFSRAWIALTWILALVLELAARRLWRFYIGRLRVRGGLALRTLVVGANHEAVELAQALTDPELGFKPVGLVSTSENAEDGLTKLDPPVVSDLFGLSSAIHDGRIDCLFVASTAVTSDQMLEIAKDARQMGVEVRVSANLPEILTPRVTVQPFGRVMAVSLRPVLLTGRQTVMKRAFDLLVAGIGLLLISPLMLLISLGVRMSGKSILFKQYRVTKGGHIFKMYKFRTMFENADEILRERQIDTSVPFFKLGEEDPRLTKVGRVIRKFSLDELPQLLNVIKGEMSLVGPRPLPADQVANNLDLLGPRHEVPAGITGWWQVHGRSDVTPEEAVRMDLFYIENWSLLLDLFILLKTAGALLLRKGAY